ncbi:hypothetical protein I4U23_011399 [Adineta vaga]|nr:hypothetical protein I4U23_011399 [Adineta vaga]
MTSSVTQKERNRMYCVLTSTSLSSKFHDVGMLHNRFGLYTAYTNVITTKV